MSVRIDDPDTSQPTRGGGVRGVLLALAGVVVVALVAWSFTPRGGLDDADEALSDRVAPTRADAAGGALERGSAPADLAGATRQVAGVPRGFPQTVDGAVASYAASLGLFTAGMATLTPQELATFVRDFTGVATDYSAVQADKRALLGVDQAGRVIDAREGDAVVSACPPALGAYRTSDVTPASGAPASVTVSYWGPCVYGVGSPAERDRLSVLWQLTTATMVWRDGDWRLDGTARPAQEPAPTPLDLNRPDTTFDQRADLLPAGWLLFDGADEDWPTDLLGQEP